MPAQTWEIRVTGPIPAEALADLNVVSLTEAPAQTVLTTNLLDQAGLQGILQRLRNLGLDLVEIRTAAEVKDLENS